MRATGNTEEKTERPAAETSSLHNPWLIGALIAIVTFLAYLPAWNGTPVWDDNAHMIPPEMRSLDGLRRIWFEPGATQQFYPVAYSAFWIAQQLWGDTPLGYHLTNIFLHVGSALLLGRILSLLKVPGAWLAAAIFALHPVHVESVAWISELKNALSGTCYLGAALLYLKYRRSKRWSFYFLALVLFVIGLGAKTVIASLPAALLVVVWWKKGMPAVRRNIAPLVPFFVVGIVAGLFTALMEQRLIGGQSADATLALIDRGLIAGRATWFYLSKLAWPAELIFIYPRWQMSAAAWWQYLFPAAAVALLVVLWAQRNRSRAPLAALLYFGGTLFPALGFVNVYPFRYSFVADHFQYLASIGPIALASAAAVLAIRSSALRNLLAVGVCLLFAALTHHHAGAFRDIETLWRATIAKNPQAWLAHNNLGMELLRTGREDEALTHFRRAVELNPRFAEAQNNLANRLARIGEIDAAVGHYQQAIELNPRYAEAQNNLGSALLRAGRVDEAIGALHKALEIDPRYAEAHSNLGNALQLAGRSDEAATHFREAIEIKPDYAGAHYNLANHFLQKGRATEAAGEYTKALELEPGHVPALTNLGALHLQMGRTEESMSTLRRALAQEPNNADAHNNLGNTLLRLGRSEEALKHFEAAVQNDASNVSAANNAAWLLATSPDDRLRNGSRAVALAETADRLTPDNAIIIATLAAALAEAGRFDEAVAAAERAERATSNSALGAAIREQIDLYRKREPSRERPATPSG
jgi:tetratricopeptide (TPR) repeat protein